MNPTNKEPFTLRDEVNALVAWAFRNGPIEDLHAGKHSTLLDDPLLSRITDEEMKALMINACQQMAKLLELKASAPEDCGQKIQNYNQMYCQGWKQ